MLLVMTYRTAHQTRVQRGQGYGKPANVCGPGTFPATSAVFIVAGGGEGEVMGWRCGRWRRSLAFSPFAFPFRASLNSGEVNLGTAAGELPIGSARIRRGRGGFPLGSSVEGY